MKVTAPEALTVRPLPEICQAARQANCGECWQVPGKPCTSEGATSPASAGHAPGADQRPGPARGPGALDAFTMATVITDAPAGAR